MHSINQCNLSVESNVQPQHARQPPCLCGHSGLIRYYFVQRPLDGVRSLAQCATGFRECCVRVPKRSVDFVKNIEGVTDAILHDNCKEICCASFMIQTMLSNGKNICRI